MNSVMLRILVFIVLFGNCSFTIADQFLDRRIQIALSIFPRIVAVDNGFETKLLADKSVLLIFVYSDQDRVASKLTQDLLARIDNLVGRPIRAESQNINSLRDMVDTPTAIFVAQKLADNQVEQLIEYTVKKGIVVFSPYVGDVERGITAGIQISNRVRPFFNIATLKRSRIEINALLMGMSRRYE